MSEALLLSVGVQDRGDDTVLSVVGELDFGTTPELLRVAEPVAALGGPVVLDLSGLTFCDSSALSALVRLHKTSKAAGGTLCLAALRQQVKVAITMTSLHRMFVIRDEVPAGPDEYLRP